MSALRWIALGLLLLLAAGLWIAKKSGPSAADPLGIPLPSASSPHARSDSELTGAQRNAPRVPAPSADTARVESAAPITADATSRPEVPICTVHIVFIDDIGVEQRSTRGQFRLVRWQGDSGENLQHDFAEGSWSSSYAPGEAWSFDEVYVEDRPAITDNPPLQRLDPSTGSIELRVHAPPATVVRVVDRASGADLGDVEIRWSDAWDRGFRMLPPSTASRIATKVRSPVTIRPDKAADWSRVESMWAGATGYGWKRFDLTPLSGGHYRVELVPGGDVEIDVSGLDTDRSNVLRVVSFQDAGSQIEDQVLEDGNESFEMLSEGRYRASLEIAGLLLDPVVLASTEFEVRAHALSHVALTAKPLSPVVKAQMSGTLVIPPEWRSKRPFLGLQIMGPTVVGSYSFLGMQSLEQDLVRTDTWNWDAGLLEVGRYEIDLVDPYFSFVVELGPLGNRDVRLEVPSPADVSVRIVDDRDGTPADIEKVYWHPRWSEQRNATMILPANRDTASGAFTFRASQGPVVVSWRSETFEAGEAEIDATPGRSEHTLRAHRATTVFFDLRDGERVVRPESSVLERAAAVTNGIGKGTWSPSPSGVALRFDHGGKYSVTLPETPGFERVPAFDVDVPEGQASHYPIRLVPRQ